MVLHVQGRCLGRLVGILACGLLTTAHLSAQANDQKGGGGGGQARGHRAFGEGTSFIDPGVLTTFQFDATEVICMVGRVVMPDGTLMQMFMVSEHVDSFTIDPAAKTVTITGSMVSFTKLESKDGTTTRLWETVPFTALAKDGGTTAKDFFSLTVDFTDTPALDQFDLFGSPAVFAGTLVSGDVTVR